MKKKKRWQRLFYNVFKIRSSLQQGSADERNYSVIDSKFENIDRKIHKAIELDQLILLVADLLKQKLESGSIHDKVLVAEELEKIMSNSAQNADLLKEVRRMLNERSNE
jgi:hypothetical protein